ncbi:hypothetical protein [Nocardia sp. 348MFTsu5.1]|uniref:hypothetical protein n=1 Tax=Nocardia sp. 348MFTsu5.1 TaxID=1172185 RepID=UPI000373789D|nr:hypothetical protein [Nocardia sp. 348MFTsu5.1]
MTIYVSSPQIPYILTFEDAERDDVAREIERSIVGANETIAVPGTSDYIEEVVPPLVLTLDADDSAFVINWGQVAFVEITEDDPNEVAASAFQRPYLELSASDEAIDDDDEDFDEDTEAS